MVYVCEPQPFTFMTEHFPRNQNLIEEIKQKMQSKNKLQLLTFQHKNVEQMKKPTLAELEHRNSDYERAENDLKSNRATVHKII